MSFLQPWLLAAQGAVGEEPRPLPARAGFAVARPGGRQEYLRVTLTRRNGELVAELAGNQSSGALSAASRADALAIVPPGVTLEPGDALEVLRLADLGC